MNNRTQAINRSLTETEMPPEKSPSTSQQITGNRLWLCFCGLVALTGVMVMARFGYPGEFVGKPGSSAIGADDAFITFRYDMNIVHGIGPVWNAGERVEGYSSPGFMLLLIPFALIGKTWLYPGAVILGAFGLLATVVWGFIYGQDIGGTRVGRGLSLFIALLPLGWLWAASGLETALVIACQLWLILAVQRLSRGKIALRLAIICTVSSVLLRVDGFVLPLIVIIWLGLQGKTGRRAALYLLVVVVVTIVAMTVWRLAYYGDPLSNTVYAKVTGDFGSLLHWAGLDLLIFFTLGGLVVLPPILNLIIQFLRLPRTALGKMYEAAGKLGLEGWVIALWLGYFILLGGDVYVERFLVFLIPLGVAWLLSRTQGGWTWVMVACVLMLQVGPFIFDQRFRLSATKRDVLLEIGDFMVQQDTDRGLIAIDAAGKIPFESELPFVDMLGLNDRYLAHGPAVGDYVGHQKFNPDYILSRKPEWIIGLAAISNDTLDVSEGLDRTKYLAAGYEIQFLGWNGQSTLPDNEVDIIDVRGWKADQILAVVRQGYGRILLKSGQP